MNLKPTINPRGRARREARQGLGDPTGGNRTSMKQGYRITGQTQVRTTGTHFAVSRPQEVRLGDIRPPPEPEELPVPRPNRKCRISSPHYTWQEIG
jgi:hypothetical protein